MISIPGRFPRAWPEPVVSGVTLFPLESPPLHSNQFYKYRFLIKNFLLIQQAKLDELKLIVVEDKNEKFPVMRINIILEEIETEFMINPLLNKYYEENKKFFSQISNSSEIDKIYNSKETPPADYLSESTINNYFKTAEYYIDNKNYLNLLKNLN